MSADLFWNLPELVLGSKEKDFVASPISTSVHSKESAMGRAWTWFYRVSGVITDQHEWEEEKLQESVLKTQETFFTYFEQLKEHLAVYKQYLNHDAEAGPSDPSCDAGLIESEHFISKYAFLLGSYFHPDSDEAKEQLDRIQQVFCEKLGQEAREITAEHLALLHEGMEAQAMIALAAEYRVYHRGTLPVPALRNLSMGFSLDQEQEAQIEGFVGFLNKRHGDDVERVQRFTQYFVEQIEDARHTPVAGVTSSRGLLEWELVRRGYDNLIHQEDYVQRAWRHGLQPGMKLQVGDEQITLGDCLGSWNDRPEDFLHYDIVERPQSVLVVGRNRSAMHIEQAAFRAHHAVYPDQHVHELQAVTISYVDPKGHFAVAEKLPHAYTQPNWRTREERIADSDWRALDPLLGALQIMVRGRFTTTEFSPEYFRLDSHGRIRTVKPLLRDRFDFDTMEAFVAEVSGNNSKIYRCLMHYSGLVNEAEYGLYQRQVESAFRGRLAGKYQVFGDEVRRLKRECRDRLIRTYQVQMGQRLDQMIEEQIKVWLRVHCVGGHILDCALDEVTRKVAAALCPKLKPRELQRVIANLPERLNGTILNELGVFDYGEREACYTALVREKQRIS